MEEKIDKELETGTENELQEERREAFVEEKILLEWEAPERSFQRRDRDFWITAVSILVLVGVILFFVKEFFLIIALCSVLFLYYVLSTVPPENAKYKISNKAIYFGEGKYDWEILDRFWFQKSLSNETIRLETLLRFPRQIALVINSEDKEKIKEIVEKRIPLLAESPTFVDKLTKWFAERLPLENRHEPGKSGTGKDK